MRLIGKLPKFTVFIPAAKEHEYHTVHGFADEDVHNILSKLASGTTATTGHINFKKGKK